MIDRAAMRRAGGRLRDVVVEGVPPAFFGNLSWQYAATIFGMGLTFLQTLLVGRVLGAHDLGLLSVGLAVATLVFQAMELRLHEAVIKYVSEFWEKRDHARTIAIVKLSLLADAVSGSLALVAVLTVAAYAEGRFIDDPRVGTVVVLSGLGLFFMNVTTATATGVLRAFSEFRTQALITIAGAAVKLIAVIVALWWFKAGLVSVLIVTVAGNLLMNVALLGGALFHVNRRIPFATTAAPLNLLAPRRKELTTFVSHTYALSWTMIPTKDLDITILAYFAELPVIGVYRVSKTFMTAMWTISDPAFMVIYPELARMWAARRFDNMKSFVAKLTAILGVAGVALYVGAVLIMPLAIRYSVGAEFANAAGLFAAMAWGVMIWAPLVWVNPMMFAAGRTGLLLRASTAGGVIVALLYLICVPLWAAYGAAFVFAASTPIVMSLVLFLGWRAGIFPPSRLGDHAEPQPA